MDLTIARVIHILAIVHWIGGVAFVAAVILPTVISLAEPDRRIAVFEEIEGSFSFHAKLSVTLAGLSGFYMAWQLDAWDRFSDAQFWWMHAMVVVWAIFTFVLFVAEPLFLHAWYRRRAQRDPDGTFSAIRTAHWILLVASMVTIAGAAWGVHG